MRSAIVIAMLAGCAVFSGCGGGNLFVGHTPTPTPSVTPTPTLTPTRTPTGTPLPNLQSEAAG